MHADERGTHESVHSWKAAERVMGATIAALLLTFSYSSEEGFVEGIFQRGFLNGGRNATNLD